MVCSQLYRPVAMSVVFLLVACVPSPQEQAEERANLAKYEDTLTQCRLLTENAEFSKLQNSCTDFLVKDADCMVFPEQKEHCVELLRAQDYTQRKQQCTQFSQQERNCAMLVDDPWPLWLYDAANQLGIDWKPKTWLELVLEDTPAIHLGVVSSGQNSGGFEQGLELALTEINTQGGVLGRQLVIHHEVSGGDLEKARQIADSMAADPRIRVVIGRDSSLATIPVSTVYESTNIVYLTVSATNNSVIRYGMRFIFRLTPNNDNFAAALIKFCSQLNYKNVALLYSRDSHSEELAYAFRDYAVNNNLKIVFEKSFFDKQENFVDIAVDLKQVTTDIILIVTKPKTTAHIINDLRDMKIDVPVIGSDLLDNPLFIEQVGEKGNGLIIPTIYNPFSVHLENAEFSLAFHQRYGTPPDTWAAQGYDAIKLLAHIMGKEVLSTVPTNIATGLRYMSQRTGVTGNQVFLVNGESSNKSIFFKELQSEEFLLFKDKKQEEEQTQQVDIVDNRIIRHPEKPSESTEAMTIF